MSAIRQKSSGSEVEQWDLLSLRMVTSLLCPKGGSFIFQHVSPDSIAQNPSVCLLRPTIKTDESCGSFPHPAPPTRFQLILKYMRTHPSVMQHRPYLFEVLIRKAWKQQLWSDSTSDQLVALRNQREREREHHTTLAQSGTSILSTRMLHRPFQLRASSDFYPWYI